MFQLGGLMYKHTYIHIYNDDTATLSLQVSILTKKLLLIYLWKQIHEFILRPAQNSFMTQIWVLN
jgi:hypothetical protein